MSSRTSWIRDSSSCWVGCPGAAFYDFPAEHWRHRRTTNPIESTFATVRHRSKVTKGPGSHVAGLAMAFKIIESAQARWRTVNASRLVALVRAGARFEAGKLVERPDDHTQYQLPKDLHPQVLTISRRGSDVPLGRNKIIRWRPTR